jgi:hypothetical protein
METAFDLHRFDLLTALHLPLPESRAVETLNNGDLSDFFQDGLEFEPGGIGRFIYRHKEPNEDSK